MLLAFAAIVCSFDAAPAASALPVIVPAPKRVVPAEALHLGASTRLCCRADQGKAAAGLLRAEVKTLFELDVGEASESSGEGAIILEVGRLSHPQQYRLETAARCIRITAGDREGFFNGVWTLITLLRSDECVRVGDGWRVPGVRIDDWPDNPFRAMLPQWTFGRCDRAVDEGLRALASLKYNAVFLELAPYVMVDGYPKASRAEARTREELRAVVRRAQSLGLTPLPYVNSLQHLERAYRPPVLIEGKVMDLGAEENYRFLAAVYAQWLEDFDHPRVFHLGMDEATDTLVMNARKYGRSTAELLAAHVNRLAAFFVGRGVRPIIWHDMLLSPDQTNQGYAHGGAPVNSWSAIETIDRRVMLDYWNYDDHERYPVVDRFRTLGFEVVVTPWKDWDGCRRLIHYGTDRGCRVMGSTWGPINDVRLVENPKQRTSSHRAQGAVVVSAECAWNRGALSAEQLRYDPTAWWLRLLCDRESRTEAEGARPIPLRAGASGVRTRFWSANTNLPGKLQSKGLPFEVGPERTIAAPVVGIEPLPRGNLVGLKALAGQRTIPINGVNRPRGKGEVVLYTPAYASSTRTNPFGVEVQVIRGCVARHEDYSTGNMHIPGHGFVLSAHVGPSGKANALRSLLPRQAVRIVDVRGRELLRPVATGGEIESLRIPLAAKAKRLWWLWATEYPAPDAGVVLGEVVLHYADGQTHRQLIRYAHDIVAWSDPRQTLSAAAWLGWQDLKRNLALAVCRWYNPRPGAALTQAEIRLTADGHATGLVVVGLTAVSD
ncbi:MAG: hypothetical protein JXQ73_09860 [Phycisphaerae bacterium]|nr:hypothetical protein [Phycisphaerae bacterium]